MLRKVKFCFKKNLYREGKGASVIDLALKKVHQCGEHCCAAELEQGGGQEKELLE